MNAQAALRETHDIVYTGIGALNWLPDVRRWVAVVVACLRPGGSFYLCDGHPVLYTLEERSDEELRIRLPYFERAEPVPYDSDTTTSTDPSSNDDAPTRGTTAWTKS